MVLFLRGWKLSKERKKRKTCKYANEPILASQWFSSIIDVSCLKKKTKEILETGETFYKLLLNQLNYNYQCIFYGSCNVMLFLISGLYWVSSYLLLSSVFSVLLFDICIFLVQFLELYDMHNFFTSPSGEREQKPKNKNIKCTNEIIQF